jgi:hypothetical protein
MNTLVTISLHPQNILAIKGYNEETAPYVAAAFTAFDEAYQGLCAIHEARIAASKNPTLNSAAQLVAVAEFADKRMTRILRAIDSASTSLQRGITGIEEMLSAPLQQKANSAFTAEIRAHVKSLSASERRKFLSEAQHAGDLQTLEAVLGAPGYLSGISNEEKSIRTRIYHSNRAPEQVRRLEVMKLAFDLLGQRGGLVHSGVEKAIGASWAEVNRIRKAKAQAEEAFR